MNTMSAHFDIIIKEGTALLSHPQEPYRLIEETTDIGILNGRIAKIGTLGRAMAKEVFHAKGLYVLPGLIDTQVHFREPGMEHKEDIESGSKSALLGGMTAFFEMPNTRPPTVTKSALDYKIQKAHSHSYCDFAFFVGASPENLPHLPGLSEEPHCPGVKIFMGSSTGSLLLHEEEKLDQVLKTVSKKIAIHSEDEARLKERKQLALSKPGQVRLHPVWRDPECALISTKKIVALAQKHKRQVHILHLTTEEEVDFLSKQGAFATAEATPQHLTLCAPECYDQLGTLAQMNPPIREKRHQDALWRGIHSNVIVMLGSDHAPHTLKEKQQAYPHSPAGMPGTQTMLTLMLNHVNQKRLSLKKLVELLAVNPHRYYCLKEQGLLYTNFKANITFVDMKKAKKISRQWLSSKCGWSPFENKQTTGWPVGVLLNGAWAVREDEIIGPPKGKPVNFARGKAL